MSENDVPDNLTFLLGSDPVEGGEAPSESEVAPSSDAPQEAYQPAQEAVAPQEDPNERRFRGVLNELRDTRQELRAYREAERAKEEEKAAREREEWERQNTPPPPDKDADPAAWLAYQNRVALYEAEQARLDREAQFAAQQETVAIRQQFHSTVVGQEEEFRAARPDYDQAVSYAKQLRAQELSNLGYAPEQVEHQVQREIIGFAALNLRNGQSPAEAAYNYAVSRGYRNPYQQAGTPAPQQAYYPTAQSRMNASLSAVSGTGAGSGIDLGNLAQQPIAIQNYIMDNSELWERVNMGDKVYL